MDRTLEPDSVVDEVLDHSLADVVEEESEDLVVASLIGTATCVRMLFRDGASTLTDVELFSVSQRLPGSSGNDYDAMFG